MIGCGESGIVAGIRLKEAGLPFTIVERAPAPGGTWQANRYPGARVDVGSHHYSYSFEPSETWTEYFCRQPELQRYFEHAVDKYGLRQHCRFDTEVVRASWDDEAQRWREGTLEAEETRLLTIGLYFRNELLLMLEQAGFADVEVQGDHNDRPATSDDEFIVFVAKK